MARTALPEHKKLDAVSPLRTRLPVSYRRALLELASEVGMSETAFSRTAILYLFNALAKDNPQAIDRAVIRTNQFLHELGMPPITEDELLAGEGLPENGVISWTQEEVIEHAEECWARQPKYKVVIRNLFSPFWRR